MFVRRKKRSRRKTVIILISIIAVILLIIRPSIGTKRVLQKQPVNQSQSVEATPNDYLFSVAVNNRYFHLAMKKAPGVYELLYVSPYHSFQIGDRVYTTGMDKQLKPDIFIGTIAEIINEESSIFSNITIRQ